MFFDIDCFLLHKNINYIKIYQRVPSLNVTNLNEMSRMSASYKLRKWSIYMISRIHWRLMYSLWYGLKTAICFSNVDTLKPFGQKWVLRPKISLKWHHIWLSDFVLIFFFFQDATPLQLCTRRCCDFELTSITLIQRRNNVERPVGWPLWSYCTLYSLYSF